MSRSSSRDPNRVVNLGYAISNKTRSTRGRERVTKQVSPQEAEKDLIEQIVKMEQYHHSQMPGGNREQRRLLARKVRKAALEKQSDKYNQPK